MKISDFVGDYAIHDYYGIVFVENAPPKSKAIVNITVKQRGKGWNESTQQYEMYKNHVKRGEYISVQYNITKRDEYGVKDLVHIKTLSKIT